ncbi:MAG: hypothetical protein JWO36_6165 [Myxococcales bacterium]|nr:hypothetical protein [Myxococcales bacterium]
MVIGGMHLARLLVIVCVVACRSGDRGGEAAPAPITKTTIDEPSVTEDGVLVIPVARAAAGVYELHFGKGRALLSLDAGTLVAPDPVSGAIALEALAKWLGVPVPPKTHSQPLRPLAFEAIALADNQNKVFFNRGAEYAEMYINIRDDRHVEFVPKDEDYATPLADMFADALRDGPAPARTKQTDPGLETEEPRYLIGRELDPDGGHNPGCLGDGWFVFKPTSKTESVWFAKWGAATLMKVCDLPGAVDGVALGVHSGIAVAVVTGRDPRSHVVGGEQTATLWTIGPLGCHAIVTPKDLRISPLTAVYLSPTGTAIAFTENDDLVTFPVEKGKSTRTPITASDLVYAWDDDGIQLHDLKDNRTRVIAGQAPTKLDHHSTISPDGAYTATLFDASVEVFEHATRRSRTFKPTFRSDIRAIKRANEEAPQWIGPHALILRGIPDLILDATSLHTRPLSDPAVAVVCTSSDGLHALVQQDKALYQSK